jgi:hypothetical protein
LERPPVRDALLAVVGARLAASRGLQRWFAVLPGAAEYQRRRQLGRDLIILRQQCPELFAALVMHAESEAS